MNDDLISTLWFYQFELKWNKSSGMNVERTRSCDKIKPPFAFAL